MSSESAEPSGWLRLGDLAIGDGGVCVTSLIKDKIREYMLNEEQQHTSCAPAAVAKTPASATAATTSAATNAAAAAAATTSKDDSTCVRRIGNSLDLLLRESRNAGHAVAATAARNRTSASAPAAPTAVDCGADDHAAASAVSTTITAPADSSRPTADETPLPPTYSCEG